MTATFCAAPVSNRKGISAQVVVDSNHDTGHCNEGSIDLNQWHGSQVGRLSSMRAWPSVWIPHPAPAYRLAAEMARRSSSLVCPGRKVWMKLCCCFPKLFPSTLTGDGPFVRIRGSMQNLEFSRSWPAPSCFLQSLCSRE